MASETVSLFLRLLAGGFITFAWAVVALWGLEKLWPRDPGPDVATMRKALAFWLVYILANAAIFAIYYSLARAYRIEPLFDLMGLISQWPWWVAVVMGPLATLVIYDFFNYWMHRAQHRWFWRQHRIHHSIEHLSALNSYFHPTEPLFRVVAIFLPMSLIFGVVAAGTAIAGSIIITLHGYYVHAPTRLNVGRIGRMFLVDNAFHRIHHSAEAGHFDRNFGAFTTIWDRLFGTAHFPERDDWPDVGVLDFREPSTVGSYLAAPFVTKTVSVSRSSSSSPRSSGLGTSH